MTEGLGLGLRGAVAVATGGASGIGAACNQLLEASGADVLIVDRAVEPPRRRSSRFPRGPPIRRAKAHSRH